VAIGFVGAQENVDIVALGKEEWIVHGSEKSKIAG
jgi:hypothetical protein